jgi:hypothetical protein
MVDVKDAADGGEAGGEGDAAARSGNAAAEEVEVLVEEDRRDRDTRLSRASAFRVAGPRLRSS